MKALTLREVQLAELNILIEFDKICQANNLHYSLAGGTLLGAVRHNGFIPWDDDIDVCMPRPEYEKFRSLFTSDKLFLSKDIGIDAKYPFLKILDSKIILAHEGSLEVDNLWIDVFPIDGLPSNEKALSRIYKKAGFYRKVIGFNLVKDFSEYRGKHNKFTATLIRIFSKLYGATHALKKSKKLAQKINYEDSTYVGAVTWGCYGVGERMLKSEYEKFTKMEFEGYQFSVMGCWDSYLHGIYGDYMQLPPEDKRTTHHIRAYIAEQDE